MEKEIIMLIIGTLLGASISFFSSQLEKRIDYSKAKKKAFALLKIELLWIKKPVENFFNRLSEGVSELPGTDILELEMSIQVDHFAYFDKSLAGKIFELSIFIKSLNIHRQLASSFLHNQLDPSFSDNYNLYLSELKKIHENLHEINKIVHFEDIDV